MFNEICIIAASAALLNKQLTMKMFLSLLCLLLPDIYFLKELAYNIV